MLKVLKSTCKHVVEEMRTVPLAHWNESVFRFFYVRQLVQLAPSITCHTEWKRIDLLIQSSPAVFVLEFKFFHARLLIGLSGRRLRWKGRPGKKNFSEFTASIEKLHKCCSAGWQGWQDGALPGPARGFLVLAYADPVPASPGKSFGDFYDQLPLGPDGHPIEGVKRVEAILPRAPVDSGIALSCKLIEVEV